MNLWGYKRIGLITVICCLLWLPCHADTDTASQEYKIKAAFIYNFAKFFTWPDTAFINAEQPLIIGVLGDDPFHGIWSAILQKTIRGRAIRIDNYATVSDIGPCHILFSNAKKTQYRELFSFLGQNPVLTISDQPGFAKSGGMIELIKANNKIRFAINQQACRKAMLQPSSQLLKLAMKSGAHH